jgi:hypothetical protein
MPYLTIAGITVRVVAGGFQELESHWVGDRLRALSGRVNTTRSGQKRRWSVTLDPRMTEAQRDTLEAAIGVDQPVTMDGDAMRAPTTVLVSIVDNTHQADPPLGSPVFYQFLRLDVEEV